MFFFSKYHKLYIIWYPVLFFNLSRNKIRLFAHDFMSYKFIVNSFEEEIFSKWKGWCFETVNEVLKLQQVHFEIGNEIESDIDNSRDDISHYERNTEIATGAWRDWTMYFPDSN